MTDYEQKIANFFNSVIAILDENSKRVKDDKKVAEIQGNIERVRKIAKVPHLMTNFQTRWRLCLNPTKAGFTYDKINVYPEFIEVLNAIHMYYNSDLPNRNIILGQKLLHWNMAVSANKFNRFVTKLRKARADFVRYR